MPKVIYDKTKGLHQVSGSGFVLAAESVSGNGAADPGTAVTVATAACNLSLADGSTAGQLKYFVSTTADDVVVTPANTTGAWVKVTLTNIGDSITCLWSGGGWVLLSRQSGTAAGASAVASMPVIANS